MAAVVIVIMVLVSVAEELGKKIERGVLYITERERERESTELAGRRREAYQENKSCSSK